MEKNKKVKIPLNESDETTKAIIESWREDSKNLTLEELPDFLNMLMTRYSHDYGTICHALAVGATATMWAMNKEEQGGVTGFQAGAITWEVIQNWDSSKRDKPMTLTMYDQMLYPQYDHKFEKTITKGTWEWLQEEAEKNLEKETSAHENVIKHWHSIVDGVIPFGYKISDD